MSLENPTSGENRVHNSSSSCLTTLQDETGGLYNQSNRIALSPVSDCDLDLLIPHYLDNSYLVGSPPVLSKSSSKSSIILDTYKNPYICDPALDFSESWYSPETDFRYWFDKSMGVKVYELLSERGHLSHAIKLKNCGQEWATKICFDCGHQERLEMRCESLLCPRCRGIRSAKLVDRYVYVVSQARRPRFLTLTLVNVPVISPEVVRKMGVYFARLRRRKCWSKVRGGVYNRETTITRHVITVSENPDRSFNIHLHILYDGFIDFTEVREDWCDITDGSSWIRDVPVVPNSKDGYKKAVQEVIGYSSKTLSHPHFGFETAEDFVDYFEAFRGFHLLQPFGCFFGLKFPKEPTEYKCEECGSTNVCVVHDFITSSIPPP